MELSEDLPFDFETLRDRFAHQTDALRCLGSIAFQSDSGARLAGFRCDEQTSVCELLGEPVQRGRGVAQCPVADVVKNYVVAMGGKLPANLCSHCS